MPARNNSPFLTGCFKSAARSFKLSRMRYSGFGIVKLSRTNLIFLGLRGFKIGLLSTGFVMTLESTDLTGNFFTTGSSVVVADFVEGFGAALLVVLVIALVAALVAALEGNFAAVLVTVFVGALVAVVISHPLKLTV
jgi:hypothetical protein